MRLFSRKLTSPIAQIPQGQVEVIPTTDGGAVVSLTRGRGVAEDIAVMKPNQVHALVIRADGSVEDLGIANNLRTNVGVDWQADTMGGKPGTTTGTPATASSATSLTRTGSGWTVDAYKGWRVIADNGTNPPVYGNVGTNSSTVLTVDQWWAADGTTGTTPGATAAFALIPASAAMFIGLTTDSGAASASSTALTSEITTNGLARAAGTYAHTGSATSYTLTKTFNATGTHTGVHRAGLFTASTTTAGGVLVFETVLNADATLANGDSLQITWTVNI